MAIAYDAPSNKITVTGYTSGSRCPFGADIRAADVAGAWGVFFNPFGRQYYSTAHVQIGDGSTATYVESLREMFYLGDALTFQVLNAADMNIGAMYGSWGHKGSHWSIGHTAHLDLLPSGNAGALRILGSHFHTRSGNRTRFYGGTLVVNRSTMSATWAGSGTYRRFELMAGDITLDDVVFTDIHSIFLSVSPTLMRNIRVHRAHRPITAAYCGGVTVSGLNYSSISYPGFSIVGAEVHCVDPAIPLTVPAITGSGDYCKERYTCTAHLTDADGNDDAAASLLCEDKDGNTVFDANTDGSGIIAEQVGVYQQWAGASEELTKYFPFKFTATFGDGVKFIIPNVPWDAPLSAGQPWEIHHPDHAAPGKVEVSTIYADGSQEGRFVGGWPTIQTEVEGEIEIETSIEGEAEVETEVE